MVEPVVAVRHMAPADSASVGACASVTVVLSCPMTCRTAGWREWGLALVLAVLSFATSVRPTHSDGDTPAEHAAAFHIVTDSGFVIDRAPWLRRPFDAVSTDMDGDGDADLLINWHHHEPLELFENRDGRFVHLNPIGNDPTGLYDNPGVPYLFANADRMSRAIDAAEKSGLYIWHDVSRTGFWRFRWEDPEGLHSGTELELETSLAITEVEGLDPEAVVEDGGVDRRVRVTFDSQTGPDHFALQVRRAATELFVRLTGGEDGPTPPVFVGAELSVVDAAALSLWKPDPHGMAWVDVRGNDRPELYLTRGGLGGELVPPARPKSDRFYLGTDPHEQVFRKAKVGVVPHGYGRGRRVEWVDTNGDGSLELAIGSEKAKNAVLSNDPTTGRLVDVAPSLGLDLEHAAIQAWGDLDSDGLADLFYLADESIDVRSNVPDGGFRSQRGRELGLAIAAVEPSPAVIQPGAMRFVDFDNDGDLDLWLVSHGKAGSNHVYRRDQERYTNVSAETGIDKTSGSRAVVFLDIDNDGYEDAVSFGRDLMIWHNMKGARFRVMPLGPPGGPGRFQLGTAADFNGDGRTDLVAVGRQRHYFRNAAENTNGFLDVELRDGVRPPIGALVTATYSDGTRRQQRYGSATNTAYSQTVNPLHFGIGAGVELSNVTIRWPGRGGTTTHGDLGKNRRLTIRRPVSPERP